MYKIHTCSLRQGLATHILQRTLVVYCWPVVSKWGLGRHLGVSFLLFSSRHLPSCVYRRMTIMVRMHQQGGSARVLHTFSRHKETLRLYTAHKCIHPPSHCKSNKNRKILFYFVFSIQLCTALFDHILTCQNSVLPSAGLLGAGLGGLISSIVYPLIPRLLDEPMHKIEISTSCAEHLLLSCSISHSWLTSLYAPN